MLTVTKEYSLKDSSQFNFRYCANIRMRAMRKAESYKEGTMGNDFSILRRVTTFLYGRLLIGLPSRVVCVRFMCVLAEISPRILLEEREREAQ